MPSVLPQVEDRPVLPAVTSILFEGDDPGLVPPADPDYFRDLNLDQLFVSMTAGRAEYELWTYFATPLTSADALAYRHEVLLDLQDPHIGAAVRDFAVEMRSVRGGLDKSTKYHYTAQRRDAFLRAGTGYVTAVRALNQALPPDRPSSRGLSSFATTLSRYVASDLFVDLSSQAESISAALAAVTYRMHLYGDRVYVSLEAAEDNYAADVATTFERFQQRQVESQLAEISIYDEMNHVEASIADLVARLYRTEFAALAQFCEDHAQFVEEFLSVFDREAQFYLSCLDLAQRLSRRGLSMCLPEISDTDGDIWADTAFDVALADTSVDDRRPVVCNDLRLTRPERILVVTGPNQGGKTTFARTIGQLTYLAGLGLLVPGTRARVMLPDRIFTHFERGENLQDLTGGLEDDLVRIRDILRNASERSLIIINEIFTSTALEDAVMLSTNVLRKVMALGCTCVVVTFLDELAALDEAVVSMVAQVVPDDPSTQTFRVVRQRADGNAYAEAVANKYGLTYSRMKARLAR